MTRFNTLLPTFFFVICLTFCSAFAESSTNKSATNVSADTELDEIRNDIDELKTAVQIAHAGTHRVLLSGNIRFSYWAHQGDTSTFEVLMRFHPYWMVGKRFLAKADTQFYYQNNQTQLFLFFAELGYMVTDWLTVKAGAMLCPFGFFQEGVHVEWVQKMADEPLPVTDDLIVPTQIVGLQARGSIPLGDSDVRINYAAWVANGPKLNDGTANYSGFYNTHHGNLVTNYPGALLFNNNYEDNNNNKTVGGRIAFLPFPQVELGYSALYGQVGDDSTAYAGINAFIQAADISFMGMVPFLKSRVELRGEYVYSKVDNADYGLGIFENTRSGWYAQFAIRPVQLKGFFGNLELVGRYDTISVPNFKFSKLYDRSRYTVCLNYWLWATIVMKFQYQWDYRMEATGQKLYNNIRCQLAGGF